MALAVTIALALSFSELLTKYRTHLLKNLINPYLFVYLALNGFFASLAYLLIPRLVSVPSVGTIEHALLAGFGYALVLRTKFMTVTLGKQELAVGPELLYTGLMNYVGFHLENRIRSKRDRIRGQILKISDSIEFFVTALNIKIGDVSDAQLKRDLETARDEIVNSKVLGATEKVYGVVRLLIEVEPQEQPLTSFLEDLKKSGGKAPSGTPPPPPGAAAATGVR